MTHIRSTDTQFEGVFQELLKRGKMDMKTVTPIVEGIIEEIQTSGDAALFEHIARFDRWEPTTAAALQIDTKAMQEAYDALDAPLKSALHVAYERIKAYHEKQLPRSWMSYFFFKNLDVLIHANLGIGSRRGCFCAKKLDLRFPFVEFCLDFF